MTIPRQLQDTRSHSVRAIHLRSRQACPERGCSDKFRDLNSNEGIGIHGALAKPNNAISYVKVAGVLMVLLLLNGALSLAGVVR